MIKLKEGVISKIYGKNNARPYEMADWPTMAMLGGIVGAAITGFAMMYNQPYNFNVETAEISPSITKTIFARQRYDAISLDNMIISATPETQPDTERDAENDDRERSSTMELESIRWPWTLEGRMPTAFEKSKEDAYQIIRHAYPEIKIDIECTEQDTERECDEGTRLWHEMTQFVHYIKKRDSKEYLEAWSVFGAPVDPMSSDGNLNIDLIKALIDISKDDAEIPPWEELQKAGVEWNPDMEDIMRWRTYQLIKNIDPRIQDYSAMIVDKVISSWPRSVVYTGTRDRLVDTLAEIHGVDLDDDRERDDIKRYMYQVQLLRENDRRGVSEKQRYGDDDRPYAEEQFETEILRRMLGNVPEMDRDEPYDLIGEYAEDGIGYVIMSYTNNKGEIVTRDVRLDTPDEMF